MKHFVSQIKLRVFFPQLDLTCVKLMNVTVFRANSGSSMKRQQSVGFDSHLRSLTHHSDGEITLQTLSHMYRFVLIYIYTKKKKKLFFSSHFQLKRFLTGLLTSPGVTMAATSWVTTGARYFRLDMLGINAGLFEVKINFWLWNS